MTKELIHTDYNDYCMFATTSTISPAAAICNVDDPWLGVQTALQHNASIQIKFRTSHSVVSDRKLGSIWPVVVEHDLITELINITPLTCLSNQQSF